MKVELYKAGYWLVLAFSICSVAGCRDAIDTQVDTGLAKVAHDRTLKPHYPILKLSDYGSSNGPEGLDTEVYGPYTEVRTKSNPALTGISEATATQALAKEYELAIDDAKQAQASFPAPTGSPGGPDWNRALHPPSGSFGIQTSFDRKATTFTIAYPSKPGLPDDQAKAELRSALLKDAGTEIEAVEAKEAAALASGKIPAGFTLCSDELMRAPRGGRDPDPHVAGLPLLITPLDRTAALKSLETAIQSILDKTAKLKSKPEAATMLVNSPAGLVRQVIELGNPASEKEGLATLLKALGSQIDHLNRSPSN